MYDGIIIGAGLSGALTALKMPKNLTILVLEQDTEVIPLTCSSYDQCNKIHNGMHYGVGLHITQSYANLLKTNIELTSQEGVGSSFYFEITCKIGQEKPSIAPSAQSPPPTLASSKHQPSLLLIEDNTIALKILESLVANAGCRFISAVNAEEALVLAKKNSFSFIIADVGLPGMSGIEFTKKLARAASNLYTHYWINRSC